MNKGLFVVGMKDFMCTLHIINQTICIYFLEDRLKKINKFKTSLTNLFNNFTYHYTYKELFSFLFFSFQYQLI